MLILRTPLQAHKSPPRQHPSDQSPSPWLLALLRQDPVSYRVLPARLAVADRDVSDVTAHQPRTHESLTRYL
eukprot:761142-Hanusia_phi.AAC.1